MVRVLVGNMDLQELQPLIDRFDQTETLGQQVNGSNAATGDHANLCRYFVMNVARRELRLKRHGVFALVEPTHDSALAIVQPAAENDLHLKSFRGRGS